MKEPYSEGLASHIGPESCASPCRKAGREALTGGSAGRVLSRVIDIVRGADAVPPAEGHLPNVAIARRAGTPRGLRPRARTESTSRENREVLCAPTADGVGGRVGKPMGVSRR
jgi:RNA-directed DNA polymerase